MKNMIDILSQLGIRLSSREGSLPKDVVNRANDENEWFTSDDIERSIEAISKYMLSREALEEWISNYPTLPVLQSRDVAIIMAGNIPLVGIFDLICTLMAGHSAWIKPSSKDRVLMEYMVGEFKLIEPTIPIYIYDDTREYDAVIATGGDNASRYFKSRFKNCRILSRGNRHSVAILAGDESKKKLEQLSKDIYTYSGLGCRNVSMIFAPKWCKVELPQHNVSQGYRNNYLQQRAIHKLNRTAHSDNGTSIFIKSRELPSALSVITIYEYDSLEEVKEWLENRDDQLQCVVTDVLDHPRAVSFGEAQMPKLMDYPDAVDVMKFLDI